MTLTLKTRPTSPARPPFTFSPASPSPPPSTDVPRPPADLIPERDMHMFGALPLLGSGEPGRGLIKCTRCGRAVLESAGAEHKRICAHVLDGTPLTTKKTTKADKSTKTRPESTKKRRASDISQETDPSPTKKRAKLPPDAPLVNYKGLKKSEVKRLLKEKARTEKRAAKERERLEVAERKRLRATGPVNYDRQCGVINDKNLPCSRSLTCKTHTVGAKRAVEGRSRPYDELYLEWQRANNPNFKEPTQKVKKPTGQGGAGGGGSNGEPTIKKRKKEWEGKGTGGDGEGDEDGEGSWEELLHFTRVAGDKVGGVRNGKKVVTGSTATSSVWRLSGGAQLEFAAVGDLMAKALAARAAPISTTQTNAATTTTTLKAAGGAATNGRPLALPQQGQQLPLSMASGPGSFAPSANLGMGMGQQLFSVTA